MLCSLDGSSHGATGAGGCAAQAISRPGNVPVGHRVGGLAGHIRPQVVHEFEDRAILKVFGQHGEGMFVAPSAIEAEICRRYGVRVVGRMKEVQERICAISVERRLKHSAVVAISNSARELLLGSGPRDK